MNIRYTTFLSYVIMIIFAMLLTVISPLLPEISKTFSLSMARSGFLFTANFIGFVIFILAGGVVADRIGKKPVLLVSLAVFSLGLLAFPLAPNFETACWVMVLVGGCGGILESQIGALIADINPENTGFYVNLTQVFFGIGAIGGPVMAAALIDAGYGWRTVYFILSGLSALLTCGFLFTRIPKHREAESIRWGSFVRLIRNPWFLLVCLCMVLYTGSEVGGWGWLSTFLKKDLGFSIAKSGVAVSVFWIAMTLGRWGCGPFILRFKTRSIIIVLAFLSGVATFLTGFMAAEWSVWVTIFLIGIAYSSLWPLMVAYGGSRYPNLSGTVFALLVGFGGLGGTVIPYLMGFIGQYANIRYAMVSPAILFLIIAFIFLGIEKAPAKLTEKNDSFQKL